LTTDDLKLMLHWLNGRQLNRNSEPVTPA